MDGMAETLAVDPPAYTPAAPAAPTSVRRSVEDTRALILANASIIKPRQRTDAPIELIVGKTKPPALAAASTRSFTSQTSNITIRINDTPGASGSSNNSPERRPSDSGVRVAGRHYAALVNRSFPSNEIHMLILGEPQDTVEEALEWMLDRTEIVITDMLSRHRKQVGTGCCSACGHAVGLKAPDGGK